MFMLFSYLIPRTIAAKGIFKNAMKLKSIPGLFFPATGDRVYLLVEKFEILESIILREVVYNKLVG